jgi:hypothetical protein
MAGRMVMVVTALVLFSLGWVGAGIAQATKPDFELIVRAPAGETTIECVRGCNLAWVERGLIQNAKPIPEFKFGCSGVGATNISRCSSGKVGGWVTP